MSEININPDIIKKTQNTLGKFVKKPPLTEKLLKKPPFRFLHDVINVVIRETGFLKGLYTSDELNSENIKDREGKINYLQKLIDVVNIVTGENLIVRPSKIVAGQEPDKTNELLQAIGHALEKKLDSRDAVESVKNGDIPKTKSNDKVPKKKEVAKEVKPPKVINKDNKVTKSVTGYSKSSIQTKKITDKIKVKENEKPLKEIKNKVQSDVPAKKSIKIGNKTQTEANKESSKSLLKNKDDTRIDSGIKMDEPLSNGNKEEPLAAANSDGGIELDLTEMKETPNEITKDAKIIKVENIVSNKKIEHQEIVIDGNKPSDDFINIIDEEAAIRRLEKEKKLERHKQRRQSTLDDKEFKEVKNVNPLEMNSVENSGTGSYDGNIDFSKTSIDALDEKLKKDLKDLAKQNHSLDKTHKRNKEVIGLENSKIKEVDYGKETNKNDVKKGTLIQEKSLEDKKIPRPRTSLRPPSVRPASARPGAPRRRDRNIEIVLQPDEMIKLGEINVKMENFNIELEDDGENLVIIEDSVTLEDNLYQEKMKGNDKIDSTVDHGHLVRQILETQKGLTGASGENIGDDTDKKNDDWNLTASRNRQSSAKQMDSLRDAIQKLTRSVNPLGKLMDFLQEDIDSMQRELSMWREKYLQAITKLNQEKNLTENAIDPLKNQLSQIEANISEHIDLVNNSRANILQNEEKIHKLLIEL